MLRQTHTTMRSGVAGQNSRVQTVGAIEANEIAHRCRHKAAAARDTHVHIGIGNDGSAGPIDDLAVDVGMMIELFLDDFEGAGLREMTVTAGRDRC